MSEWNIVTSIPDAGMQRRIVISIIVLIAVLCFGGITVSLVLYHLFSSREKDAINENVRLACISVRKVLTEKFQASITLMLSMNDRIADHGWLTQARLDDLIISIGRPLAWADMELSELELVKLADFYDWQKRHHTITHVDPETGVLEPEEPVRPLFLPVLTRHPCCTLLGFDWFSDLARTNIVRKSLDNRTPIIGFLPILTPEETQRRLVIFAPVFNHTEFFGGMSSLYNSDTILVGASEFLEPQVAFMLFFGDELVYRQSEWSDSLNMKVNETFAVLNEDFVLACGYDYIPSVAPFLMMLFGISLSMLAPVISLSSWRAVKSLRFKDAQIMRTQRELQEARLREQEAVLRYENEHALSEAKSQFMANISHEIRTPLNAVSGMTDFLLESDLHSIQREYVNVIKTSLSSLLKMLDDIFDYARLETGQFDLCYEDYDLFELMNTVDRTSTKSAVERGNTFILDCPLDHPTFVKGDSKRISQVLSALISNANKFTDNGTVTLTVRLDFENNQLVMSVGDTGIGMTEDQVRNLFKAYRQYDQSNTRRFSGMGLGLALCKKLIAAMGGTISVFSELNVGSVFTVKLPLVSGFEPLEEEHRELYKGHGVVLIADDNAVNIRVAEKMVKSLGYETISVTNGQEAIDKYNERKDIDLILMDGQMPVMDGYEATRELRRQGVTIPIVCMTANVLPGEKQRVKDLGMTDLFPKPVDKWCLSKMLHDLIK